MIQWIKKSCSTVIYQQIKLLSLVHITLKGHTHYVKIHICTWCEVHIVIKFRVSMPLYEVVCMLFIQIVTIVMLHSSVPDKFHSAFGSKSTSFGPCVTW